MDYCSANAVPPALTVFIAFASPKQYQLRLRRTYLLVPTEISSSNAVPCCRAALSLLRNSTARGTLKYFSLSSTWLCLEAARRPELSFLAVRDGYEFITKACVNHGFRLVALLSWPAWQPPSQITRLITRGMSITSFPRGILLPPTRVISTGELRPTSKCLLAGS